MALGLEQSLKLDPDSRTKKMGFGPVQGGKMDKKR